MPTPFASYLVFLIFISAYLLLHTLASWSGKRTLVYALAIGFSFAYMAIASVETFVFSLVMAAITCVYVGLGLKRWFLLGLLPLTIVFSAGRLLTDFDLLVVLFQSFVFIRCAGTIMYLAKFSRTRFTVFDTLLAIVYFPTFAIGPIHFPDRINLDALMKVPELSDVQIGLLRFITGMFMTVWLSPNITGELPGFIARNALDGWDWVFWLATVWARLFNLFILFAGFSAMAIGFCRIMGLELRENFNRPWRSRTIQEFWQRWHMSLVWTTNNLGYQPFVRATGRRYIGIVLAFTFIGVWHAYTPQYLFWGVAHGAALAGWAWMSRQQTILQPWSRITKKPAAKWVAAAVGWFMTMSYVAILSNIASGQFG